MAAKVAATAAVESLSTPASRAAFSAASGSFAGMVSAITGLGGAVVFVPALSRLGFKAKDIVGTTVAAVTGATAAGSLAYAQKGVTGTSFATSKRNERDTRTRLTCPLYSFFLSLSFSFFLSLSPRANDECAKHARYSRATIFSSLLRTMNKRQTCRARLRLVSPARRARRLGKSLRSTYRDRRCDGCSEAL